ncbi:MAG TPA: single-stranded DNA-binding protein [Candidatus Babeliales bacterium]|nr:single-stranded DNA-binding protein [Candidatus Babeliales bacterium]
MAGYNRIIMIGNLTRDPEYKQLTSGQPVCRLGIATNRQFKNRQTGSMVQEVCYIDVDVWGAQAESCRQYLQKGRSVLIEGRLKLDTWQDQSGQSRSKHSIVADRVVFLSAGGAVEDVETGTMRSPLDPKEQDVMDQIEQIKAKTAARGAVKAKRPMAESSSGFDTGEIAFNDEQPFQDDLPF